MSKNNKRKEEKRVKYCVFCGKYIEEGKIYCPNCGKLVLKIKPEKEIGQQQPIRGPIVDEKIRIVRKCPGCGSIITSNILEQCPICNSVLGKISEQKKEAIQKKPSLIFTNKKLELEQKFILKKETWNLKEGINVFGTSIYILVIAYFLLVMAIAFQADSDTPEINIYIILLSQIPELLFGIYPLWYIYSKKHSYKKLGFFSESNKQVIIAIISGILGGGCLLIINFISSYYIDFLSSVGLDFFELKESISTQTEVIQNTDILMIIVLMILLSIGSFSVEVVFRGVLHNTLKERFKNDLAVVLIIALIYSAVWSLYTYPSGLVLFLVNFIIFIVLGILYEINGNLYNTIIASIFFNFLVIIFLII
ncbi:MAG: type II CAAX prenyl endopeptidase Rce1 family protein [Promethearchaeota archaeon]